MKNSTIEAIHWFLENAVTKKKKELSTICVEIKNINNKCIRENQAICVREKVDLLADIASEKEREIIEMSSLIEKIKADRF
jgi:hypothetical protein